MLEVVKCAPENRHGEAFVSAEVKRGSFVVASGVFSAADIAALPTGQKNKPGYAYSGDKKVMPAYVGTWTEKGMAYVVDKKVFIPEDADTDSAFETIKAGAQVVFYGPGEYRTTEFTDVNTTDVYGNYLKLTASGTITSEATVTTPTAETVARTISLDDDHASPGDYRLHFELINVGI